MEDSGRRGSVEAMPSICGSEVAFSLPGSWLRGFRSETDLNVQVAGFWLEMAARRRCGDDDVVVAVAALVGLWFCWIGLDLCSFLAGPSGCWAWALAQDPYFY
ncbi:hypothetical protein RchiOBHm_Chr2g0132851 [Rosa chinensis]|uniref:Uncharacterized protein n=1 Tax=Rosa chinensis TaxID=74649 RepID=A0A2P6RVE8_ROSCH|nr:hypothetical protein RchiOBHm_Chr2g0132851 [Rosa chinensis]